MSHGRLLRQRGMGVAAILIVVDLLSTTVATAATRYHLRVNAVPSFTQRFVFSLTCSDSTNTLTISDAVHDGTGVVTSTEGGPAMGPLLTGNNPADTTTLVGGAFYSEMDLRLQNITRFDCNLNLTEHAPQGSTATSQFALYWLNDDETVRLSDDALGANALAVLDITGVAGGELSVCSPLVFVAPDTLLLNGELAGVSRRETSTRIRFSSIMPNPSRGSVLFAFNLPQQGQVELRVYDVAGRLVAIPLCGLREEGAVTASWNSAEGAGRLPSGVYFAELRFGPESAVRRFVVAR